MTQNQLLAALSTTGHQDLVSHLARVSLSSGEVLHQADAEIRYVYFPETCVVSILSTMEDGSMVVFACCLELRRRPIPQLCKSLAVQCV